jgi:Ni/Co efflux regulator RcnB
MKKFVAALAAVLTLATAGVASAQDWRGNDRDRGEWRGDRDDRGRGNDWDNRRGGRGEITVRDLRGRIHTFDRRDREWDTIIRSPFGFRPGPMYVYTDECRRGECQIHVYERGSRRPVQVIWAPTLDSPRYFGYAGYDRNPYNHRPRGSFGSSY